MTIFWLVLAALCAFLLVYPYLVYPWVLSRLSPRPLSPPQPGSSLTFALMFCAYNEEKALPETIANLRKVKAAWPQLQILAYADCCSDRTFEILNAAPEILTAVEGKERAGKPAGMAKLVARTEADIAIFMDANVLVDPATIRRFEDYFARPDVGAVAGTLHYVNEDDSVVANVGGLYWRIEEKIKRLESETGSTMGADGSLFAMRRRLYPAVRSDLQDDFLASMEVVFHDLRCISAPDILAYERAAVSSSSEFRRKRRIACGAFSSHRHMWSRVRALGGRDLFKYLSHKLIRWFGAFFLLAGFVAAAGFAIAAGLGLWFLGACLLGGLAFALALRLQVGPAVKVYEILSAIVATGVGVLESLVGAKYAIWNPTER
ncbi:glycosyltransferase [Aurantimonas sp. Leaf443]|uniref:glycosyltransferase n=1 Tax=Aurantimonas sp. Leaf443 TaxID=1736378 RepID=UPI0006F9B738|nr:glycosyltransferase [Aurantimonas sp. Leaf443]KQT85086.1 hypothetical protein ASG48_07305 [Aurantimonas sp. Leaf443]